jgi:hypothetical protein
MAQKPAREIYHRERTLGVLHRDFVNWADQNVE